MRKNSFSDSKQDLHGLLTHVYNRMTYYGEQRHTLYIINHCSDSIDSYSYDNPRVCTYFVGSNSNKQRLISDSSSTSSGCSDNNYEDGYVDITSATKVKCLEWYMQKYGVDNDTKLDWILKWYRVDNFYKSKYGNTKLKWSLKKSRVDNIKFDQKKDLKSVHPPECSFIMKREDGECSMKEKFNATDPCDYLDCSNLDLMKRAHSLQAMLSCPNPDPLKRTHSPQEMLSLIDPTGCCVMMRKDGECPDPEVKSYHRGAYQRCIGKPVADMDYTWGDNKSMINSPTVPEAKLYKRLNILLFHYVRSMLSRGYINI